jgi:hypothetical protein
MPTFPTLCVEHGEDGQPNTCDDYPALGNQREGKYRQDDGRERRQQDGAEDASNQSVSGSAKASKVGSKLKQVPLQPAKDNGGDAHVQSLLLLGVLKLARAGCIDAVRVSISCHGKLATAGRAKELMSLLLSSKHIQRVPMIDTWDGVFMLMS